MNNGLFKFCVRCQRDLPPEGGVDIGPSRWICAKCWQRKLSSMR